jgi:hypothetical protein
MIIFTALDLVIIKTDMIVDFLYVLLWICDIRSSIWYGSACVGYQATDEYSNWSQGIPNYQQIMNIS